MKTTYHFQIEAKHNNADAIAFERAIATLPDSQPLEIEGVTDALDCYDRMQALLLLLDQEREKLKKAEVKMRATIKEFWAADEITPTVRAALLQASAGRPIGARTNS